MNKTITKIALGLSLVVALVSCNPKPSLQKYIVEKQESENFISIDLPPSVVSFQMDDLSDDQKEAYESVKKINFLGYNFEAGKEEEFKTEFETVKSILADERYNELMRMGNNTNGKLLFKYLGDETNIDELVVLGNRNNKGFAVVRVLGKDMEPAKMIKLLEALKDADVDSDQLKGFADFMR